MAIKNYKPVNNSRRGMTVTDYSGLSKVAPEKSLLEPVKKTAGRNSYGRITVRHIGGGNRKKYRVIDFKRDKQGMNATVTTLEYDPNRSAFIALVTYEDGEKRYIIAPDGLKVGDTVRAGSDADIKPGNALALADIPVGTVIHNIEMHPGKGAPEYWVAVVKPGRVMFEIAGVPEETAREAMRLAMHKLPIKCKFVKKEDGGEL